MRQKVEFKQNIPQLFAMEFQAPKQVPSLRGGTQWQYFLQGERIMWVDDAAKQAIDASGAQPGEQIELCKREVRAGNRKRVEWQARVLSQGSWAAEHAQAGAQFPRQDEYEAQGGPPPAARQPPAQAQAAAPSQRTSAAPPSSDEPLGYGAALASAFRAACDVEKLSTRAGRPVMFTADDIRAMASTIYIQSKERAA